MLAETEQVFQSVLALPSEERFQLVEALIALEQGQPPFDETWREVIRRRSAEIDSGTVRAIPWSEVREQLRRQVGLND